MSDLRRVAPTEVNITEVLNVYALNLPSRDKSSWPNCCACKPRQKHKAGYLVRFDDGQRGLVGQDCGAIKHRLDYQKMMGTFDDEAERAGLLRQAIASDREADTVRAYIQSARASAAWAALLALRKALTNAFPAFMQRLMEAKGGAIVAKRRQVDVAAMQRRDARLERSIEQLATRTGARRGEPGVDGALRAQLLASGDKDASPEPIKHLVDYTLHQFSGSAFFLPLDGVGIQLQRVEQRLNNVFAPIAGKSSASLKDTQLGAIRSSFLHVVKGAKDVQATLEQARSFLMPENLAGVVGAWNRLWRSHPEKHLVFDGERINSGSKQVCVTAPTLDVSDAPLDRAVRIVEDAYSDAPQDE